MEINVPKLSLILLIGISGSGKSSFAKKHFKRTEIISSDECRALVSDDENNQSATGDAFDLLFYTAGKRLKNGLLTVVDATNVSKESRKGFIELARQYHALPLAIVLDIPQEVCEKRNQSRLDRNFGSHVIPQQAQQLRKSIRYLKEEGFRDITILRSVEEVDSITSIQREKLYNDKRDISGPFDIIGDIHGCFVELNELLHKLGYQVKTVQLDDKNFGFHVFHPQGRRVIFLGDLVDRGPDSPSVLRIVMSMVAQGVGFCVPGNHDMKLQKYLSGKNIQIKHGLAQTIEQLEPESPEFKKTVRTFLDGLISHYVFDNGNLVVSHAGIKEEMQGRGSGVVRSFCLYGETTGEIDEFGLPVRYNWAETYRGKAMVVYGHTPVPEAEWLNNTVDIDTGCVFGGKLTALRYPEKEFVSVKAHKTYYESLKPIHLNAISKGLSSQQEYDDVLNIEDVIGKRFIQTRLRDKVTIREENSIAALEVMSRFSIHPKWLIYLPPTMSPCATSDLPDYLEYPTQALGYYKKRGVKQVICEEKHMGSRAVLIICKESSVSRERFGLDEENIGICYSRTGRNFFTDPNLEKEFLTRVQKSLSKAQFWDEFQTDWVCLDAEILPWSAKAQALLREQYAAVGSSASSSLPEAQRVLQMALERGLTDSSPLLDSISGKITLVDKFIQSYRNYCWNVNSIEDYKLAPFHILATEGVVHTDKTHEWQMQKIKQIAEHDTLFQPTNYTIVDLQDEESVQSSVDWWLHLTETGGEGMVVKPMDFLTYGSQGLLQPAIKCRGKEYLRIIYGPEYDRPQNLDRLKKRGLSAKQSLAFREFALGIEAIERFIRKEPLRKVHESVFGVLALESEEIDPRL
jgi:protein phosphatase